jgi:hypothetical protein
VCCAGGPWTPPNASGSANASSSPRGKSRRPPNASANSQANIPDRTAWDAERRRALRERAAELDAQLSTRRREQLAAALQRPAAYLTEALGDLPDKSRARRTWEQAATRIEAYRFDHAITDSRHVLGSDPSDQPERAQWQRAHHDLQRAQRDLGHHNTRQHSHEI